MKISREGQGEGIRSPEAQVSELDQARATCVQKQRESLKKELARVKDSEKMAHYLAEVIVGRLEAKVAQSPDFKKLEKAEQVGRMIEFFESIPTIDSLDCRVSRDEHRGHFYSVGLSGLTAVPPDLRGAVLRESVRTKLLTNRFSGETGEATGQVSVYRELNNLSDEQIEQKSKGKDYGRGGDGFYGEKFVEQDRNPILESWADILKEDPELLADLVMVDSERWSEERQSGIPESLTHKWSKLLERHQSGYEGVKLVVSTDGEPYRAGHKKEDIELFRKRAAVYEVAGGEGIKTRVDLERELASVRKEVMEAKVEIIQARGEAIAAKKKMGENMAASYGEASEYVEKIRKLEQQVHDLQSELASARLQLTSTTGRLEKSGALAGSLQAGVQEIATAAKGGHGVFRYAQALETIEAVVERLSKRG